MVVHLAIIGGGIGGSAAAHFAREAFGATASIDVFERAEHLGGRLRTVSVAGNVFEAGGSIIHGRNRYMVNFAKDLHLKHMDARPKYLGLYDPLKRALVFQESKWKVATLAKMLWRYGLSMVKLKTLISDILDKFDNVYALQDKGQAFATPTELLEAMHSSFPSLLEHPIAAELERRGFTSSFINELALGIMKVNYGQTTTIPALVGAVSLAGAEPGLWSVENGNVQVPRALVAQAKVRVIRGDVQEIERQPAGNNPRFCVRYQAIKGDGEECEEPGLLQELRYDIVIFAAPLMCQDQPRGKDHPHPGSFSHTNSSWVAFKGLQDSSDNVLRRFARPFHRTVATFVEGELNYEFLGLDPASVANELFVTRSLPEGEGDVAFNSVSIQRSVRPDPASNAPGVWKVFSNAPLPAATIQRMFRNCTQQLVCDWLAYPEYATPDPPPSFVISPGLFYCNAIESVASAMEMSCLAARNCVLLARQHWDQTSKQSKL